MGLLRQQGDQLELERNWVARFIHRRSDLKTKIDRRQEANRFDSFTPKAVHCLVVGSVNLKQKAFLKGPQTRNWTSFIEAVTADGRALTPGIIFKGKELQRQWFLDEFRKIADWHFITSPNGWTDDHIGVEWLERVYLPQTKPNDDRHIRDLGLNRTPKTRRQYNVIAKGFEAQQQTLTSYAMRIAGLEEQLACLKRGKKRKALPNPNKRFMTLSEALVAEESLSKKESEKKLVVVNDSSSKESGPESEAASVVEVSEKSIPPQRTTRSATRAKRPKVQ
ncbi:hypothetical protein HOO65_030446 [Ceratocystis lukuohia]|uniref:DDE-1 domain-containing protein n=1 Tax=Ceratocystis lukuohia TaxID=2019550 RepID=A0ABR4MKZ3_9PEZI